MRENKEEDIGYLDEKFPKGESKLRGEAMVLLALAREEGKQSALKQFEELIDNKLNNLWKLVNSDASERTNNKVIYKSVVVVLLEDLRTKLQEKGK